MALSCFTDDYDTWIAESLDDLKKLLVEEHSILSEIDFEKDTEWRQIPDDEVIKIIRDQYLPEEDWIIDEKTAAEWVEHNGRGFLCSTEW